MAGPCREHRAAGQQYVMPGLGYSPPASWLEAVFPVPDERHQRLLARDSRVCLPLPALAAPTPPFEVWFLGVSRSRGEHKCGKEEGRGLRLCRNPSYAHVSSLF